MRRREWPNGSGTTLPWLLAIVLLGSKGVGALITPSKLLSKDHAAFHHFRIGRPNKKLPPNGLAHHSLKLNRAENANGCTKEQDYNDLQINNQDCSSLPNSLNGKSSRSAATTPFGFASPAFIATKWSNPELALRLAESLAGLHNDLIIPVQNDAATSVQSSIEKNENEPNENSQPFAVDFNDIYTIIQSLGKAALPLEIFGESSGKNGYDLREKQEQQIQQHRRYQRTHPRTPEVLDVPIMAMASFLPGPLRDFAENIYDVWEESTNEYEEVDYYDDESAAEEIWNTFKYLLFADEYDNFEERHYNSDNSDYSFQW